MTRIHLHKALALVHKDVDQYVHRYIGMARDQEKLRAACRPGCSACCTQQVTIALSDALAIIAHLEQHDPARIDALVAECLPVARMLAQPGMTGTAFSKTRLPCPLLDGTMCSVYAVRPVICRAHVSFDDPAKCSIEGANIKQAPAAKINAATLPGSVELMKQAGLPNPSGPLQYMILAAVYMARSNGKWRELADTPLYDTVASAGAWIFLEDYDERLPEIQRMVTERLGYLPKPYPVWELFEEKT